MSKDLLFILSYNNTITIAFSAFEKDKHKCGFALNNRITSLLQPLGLK